MEESIKKEEIKIPLWITVILFLVGLINIGSASFQFIAYKNLSPIEIVQGIVGMLLLFLAIFIMFKQNMKTDLKADEEKEKIY